MMPGANVNQFGNYEILNAYINASGTIKASTLDKVVYLPVDPSTQYTFKAVRVRLTSSNDDVALAIYSSEPAVEVAGTRIALSQYNPITNIWSYTFTTAEDTSYVGIKIGRSDYTDIEATLNNCQLEKGSTVSDVYTPYANICMPEGFNIWDPIEQEYIQVYAGYVNANTRELYLRPVYEEYAGEELVGPWMSSLDPYEEDTTPTEGAFVIDFGGELTSYEITPFMLQTLLDSLGIRQHFTDGAGLLNSLMDQAQGRVRSEEELLHLSRPLHVIAIGDQLPAGLTFKPISKDVLPGLPGKIYTIGGNYHGT